ncbi:LysM peptidoglycan-binding domain-containing protein [Myxococcus sp. 1LA]
MSNYRIRRGDTLSALAVRFGTTVSKLARDNNIKNPDLIYTGNTLRIGGYSGRDSFDAGGGRQGVRGGGRTGGTGGGNNVGGATGAGPATRAPRCAGWRTRAARRRWAWAATTARACAPRA